MKILERLGVFGWKADTENLLFASLLTGDPALLIGRHGTAKTHVINKVAEALKKNFVAYDASKTLFDDVLGYPDIQKMKEGRIEYLPSKVTVWDKELILIDELNRALPEMQSKYLELIRSRKIMGFPTAVQWVFAAMNPVSYSGTVQLDEALIGRFAAFIYPPDVLEMEEEDRIKVANQVNGDDCPAVTSWLGMSRSKVKTISDEEMISAGSQLESLMVSAAKHFLRLKKLLPSLSQFLARFADLLMKETQGEISLDGRRLGFLYRTILAYRSVQMAKAQLFEEKLQSFSESAGFVVKNGIPVGLNDESVNREEAHHKMETCFDLLSDYFVEGSTMERTELIYELFTTPSPVRKAEILLTGNLGEMAESKGWNDLITSENKEQTAILAYVALQVEAKKKGTVPPDMIESLSKTLSPDFLTGDYVGELSGDGIDCLDSITALLNQGNPLGDIIAKNKVKTLLEMPIVTEEAVALAETEVKEEVETFNRLMLK